MMSEARSASSLAPFDSSTSEKRSRKSYTREFKLTVVNFYRANNLYQTSKKFSLNTKTILRWTGDEEKIKDAKKGSKHVVHVRRAMYPEVETELYREYKALRKHGLKVKGFWFKTRAKQLLERIDPEASTFQTGGSTVSRSDIALVSDVLRTFAKNQRTTRKALLGLSTRLSARSLVTVSRQDK